MYCHGRQRGVVTVFCRFRYKIKELIDNFIHKIKKNIKKYNNTNKFWKLNYFKDNFGEY